MTVWLKQCPRCGGDLYLQQDTYGKYADCLQCGRSYDVNKEGYLIIGLPVTATAAAPLDDEHDQRAA